MKQKSKRVKISLEEINNGKNKIIDPKDIAESNDRIRKEMKPIVRKFIRDQFLSGLRAKKNYM